MYTFKYLYIFLYIYYLFKYVHIYMYMYKIYKLVKGQGSMQVSEAAAHSSSATKVQASMMEPYRLPHAGLPQWPSNMAQKCTSKSSWDVHCQL